MLLAIRDAGLAGGKIKFVGFDTGEQAVRALEGHGLIIQNPFLMGYLGVKTLINQIGGETVDPWVDTGIATVTLDNVEESDIADLLNPPLQEYLN